MSEESNFVTRAANRRSFLKKGLSAGAATVGAGLLAGASPLYAADVDDNDDDGGQLTQGDAAILRFLAAAEILESDLWEQYWELGGTQDNEFARRLAETRSTRTLLRSWMATWPSTSTTTPTMSSLTRLS